MKKIAGLRKQLSKKGYRLEKNGQSGYTIIDKYTNVTKNILSLDEIELFLTSNFMDYCIKVTRKKVPPLNR